MLPLPERLQSPRLVLRRPLASDARAIFESYTQDIEVARYLVWRPHGSLAETETFIAACIQAWNDRMRMPYILALREAETDPIGMLEARSVGAAVDIGYVLGRRYWGNSLMPEAIGALAEVALRSPTIFRIQATCDVENKASARTLEKAGFSQEGLLRRYTVHPNISEEPRACFMYALCR
ncbi:MAG: GNAT family protein [Burkholderiaceae bacterium]